MRRRAKHLTFAERRVVVLMSRGLTTIQAAKALDLSPNTVKAHLARVALRWGSHTAAGTVGDAYRSGAIDGSMDPEGQGVPAPMGVILPAPEPSESAAKAIAAGFDPEQPLEAWLDHDEWLARMLKNMAKHEGPS